MSEAPRAAPRRRGPPWRAMLPTLIVLALGIVWSVAWFAGAWWLDREVDEARVRAASQGLELRCAEDGIEGYPFRFSFACRDAELVTPDAMLRAPRLLATIQAYDPRHMIAEIESPASIVPARGPAIQLDWSRLLVSARTEFDRLRATLDGSSRDPLDILSEVGISADDLAIAPDGADGVSVERLTAFARPAPGAAARDAELALDAEGVAVDLAATPIRLAMRASLLDLPLADTPDFVRRWLSDGGSIDIERIDVAGEDALVRTSGQIGATPAGAPQGRLNLGFVAPSAVPGLFTDPAWRSIAASLANAVLLTGEAIEIDGRDALALDLIIEGGAMRVGFLPLGTLAPLF